LARRRPDLPANLHHFANSTLASNAACPAEKRGKHVHGIVGDWGQLRRQPVDALPTVAHPHGSFGHLGVTCARAQNSPRSREALERFQTEVACEPQQHCLRELKRLPTEQQTSIHEHTHPCGSASIRRSAIGGDVPPHLAASRAPLADITRDALATTADGGLSRACQAAETGSNRRLRWYSAALEPRRSFFCGDASKPIV